MSPSELDKLSVEQCNERQVSLAINTLQALNGAGLIALLAFLGHTWTPLPDFRRVILVAMAGMSLGLSAGTLSVLLRLRAIDRHIKSKTPQNKVWRLVFHWRLYSSLRVIAFVCFLLSISYLVVRLYYLT